MIKYSNEFSVIFRVKIKLIKIIEFYTIRTLINTKYCKYNNDAFAYKEMKNRYDICRVSNRYALTEIKEDLEASNP